MSALSCSNLELNASSIDEAPDVKKKLLVIYSSPNKLEESFSSKLGKHFVDGLQKKYPDYYDVEELDLEVNAPLRVTRETIGTAVTCNPKSSVEREYEACSSRLIQQLKASDAIIISAPMHNLTIPVSLRIWIEAIIRHDQTVKFSESGVPEGMVKGRPVMTIITSGGDNFGTLLDHSTPYLKSILGLIGFEKFFSVEVPGVHYEGAEASMQKAKNELDDYLEPFKTSTRSSLN